MNLLPDWLTLLTGRRAARQHEPDFADMGTAFGLDACMDAGMHNAPPAPAQASRAPWFSMPFWSSPG